MDRLRFDLKQGCKSKQRCNPAEDLKKRRAASRANTFVRGRNISESPIKETAEPLPRLPVPVQAAGDVRRMQLEKWKREKAEKEKIVKAKQKPIFKLGMVVSHPPRPVLTVPAVVNTGVTTRARSAAIATATRGPTNKYTAAAVARNVVKDIPKNTKFIAPKGLKGLPLTIPQSPHWKQNAAKCKQNAGIKTHTLANMPSQLLKRRFAQAHGHAAFSPLASAPSPNRLVTFKGINAGKSNSTDTNKVLFATSPNITVARGNYIQRRKSLKVVEQNASMNKECPGLSVSVTKVIASTPMASQHKSLVPSEKSLSREASEEPSVPVATSAERTCEGNPVIEKDAHYFRIALDSEVTRLNELCVKWSLVKNDPPTEMTEEVQGILDSAIGHTQLLIRSKFEQFRGLTVLCEKGTCTPPILVTDLAGFWDMLTIEIEKIDKEFQNLVQLQNDGWKEKQAAVQTKKKALPKKPILVLNKTAKPSGIRALMLAARKKQMADKDSEEKLDTSASSKTPCLPDPRLAEIKANPTSSNKRRSLLQGVLSARKAERNSPIVMRVSLSAKFIGSPSFTASPRNTVEPADLHPVVKDLGEMHFVKPSIPDYSETASSGSKSMIPSSTGESVQARKAKAKRLTILQQAKKELSKRTEALECGKENTSSNTFASLKSPSIFSPRRSMRLTPYNIRTFEPADGRASLLPLNSQASPLPLPSGDLISFATPPNVRRSTRTLHK